MNEWLNYKKELLTGIDPEWEKALSSLLNSDIFEKIIKHLLLQKTNGINVYPSLPDIFRVFKEIPPKSVRVVILGQDPYHGANQANGYSFAVHDGIKIPPSLRNIFKEIKTEFGSNPKETSLINWAKSGVFLLNSFLTVEEGKPASHQQLGWNFITDEAISYLNKQNTPIVFLLWGRFSIEKEKLITNPIHLILKSPHPSPLSAYQGFFGCDHFKSANDFLTKNRLPPIDWTK